MICQKELYPIVLGELLSSSPPGKIDGRDLHQVNTEWLYISSIFNKCNFLFALLKSGLDFFYFEIHQAPSEIPANLLGQFSLYGQFFALGWAAATLNGLV